MKLHQRKIAQFIFVLLVAGLVVLLVAGPARVRTFFAARGANQKIAALSDEGPLVLPIPLSHPRVSSVMIHYFLTGVVQEVRQVQGGSELVLRDTLQGNGFPVLLIAPETRVERISPPYGQNTSKITKTSDLKPGLTVDLSIEYDLRAKSWGLRDVFIPTDRN